ncbi:hypothetical protein [Jeongeupia naejangsanensis]|uniref:Uncharacterized protein n=1 Tax=Jeongeupia naejangsanensis TaxID=613195 RepID=A0ABS2BFB0_9NEIS|nr:hypothetical protein [Jeongeupia naejangsanensis]MBM3114298.1 hypothetical protein [Jeongeupia naejangsanensis]
MNGSHFPAYNKNLHRYGKIDNPVRIAIHGNLLSWHDLLAELLHAQTEDCSNLNVGRVSWRRDFASSGKRSNSAGRRLQAVNPCMARVVADRMLAWGGSRRDEKCWQKAGILMLERPENGQKNSHPKNVSD